MFNILVTGASGFLGGAVANRLCQEGHAVTAALRTGCAALPSCVARRIVDGVFGRTDWTAALSGQQVVIHCAGRAHVMKDTEADPLAAFRTVNLDGTLNLARQSIAAGVKRFVFISSIGVNGVQSALGNPFSEIDKPNPHNAYSISKWEAEQGLLRVAEGTGLEVVIIRPPLVYGPHAPGNFGSLVSWLRRGVPLPLGAIHNRRSMVALDNLVDLIVTCIDHPAAANQTFLVSDGEDLSTTQLLQRLGRALGKPARLLPVPATLLKAGAALVGKPAIAQRLCGSLQVDISKTQQLLGWAPPLSVDEGLKRAAEGYLREASV